jgi:Rad51
LSQNIAVKTTLSQPVFPLNLRNVKEIFPGFALGDFAVLQGASVSSLISMLCVKAQLPTQLGGLQSSVVFIDGGNIFKLYQIARLAQLNQINPKKVLDNIYISRVFTAYQEASLITQHLKEAIQKYDAKLVIISDIAGFFSDTDIPEDEAQRIFGQVATFLSNFAQETRTIIIATYLQHAETPRNDLFHTQTIRKANVVLSIRTGYARHFILEKHPCLSLGFAELSLEDLTLADFAESNA